jgi:ADP-ribose pyrophosphatase YjhB (NUDIX family)
MVYYNLPKTVRIVIQKEEHILFCRKKGEKHYFLPGWDIDCREKAEMTLRREVRSIIRQPIKKYSYIGALGRERTNLRGKKERCFDLIFEVEMEKFFSLPTDQHIEFAWKHQGSLLEHSILPEKLRPALSSWLQDKRVFWAS